MALRKLNKYMKIVTITIIIAFAFSALFAGYSSISTYFRNKKEVLLKFEGHKIYKEDYEQELSNLKNQIVTVGKITDIPDEFLAEIALSSIITRESSKVLSENLKVNVSNSDVDAKVKEIEDIHGGRSNVAVLLAQNGSNLTLLKEEIRNSLLMEKTIDKVKQTLKPTDKDLEAIYNRYRYIQFPTSSMDEVTEQLENIYYGQTLELILNSSFEKILLDSKISTSDENIKALFEKIKRKEIEYKELYVLRKDMYKYYFARISRDGKYTPDLEKNVNEEQIKELMRIYDKSSLAKSNGVKSVDNLTPLDTARYEILEYFNMLIDTNNPTEAEMRAWYNIHKSSYDIPNTISGEILGIVFKPSEADLEMAHAKANDLLKTLNAENFDKLAKENSEDPGSAINGGDLGWADISQYVPEFEQILEYDKDSIVGPIKTNFGYHLVYIVDKDEKTKTRVHLKHILIAPKISEETKKKDIVELQEISQKLKDKKLSWVDINEDKTGKYTKFDIKEEFSGVTKSAALPVIGYQREFLENLFNEEIGTVIEKDLENSYVIVKKTEEIPYKSATYEEFKDRVKSEINFEYAEKQIRE
ncbi:peptidylprolyl isomerase [Oceanivirga salmonicida]|uniref:peptidylprolyl isomerase n=1 Tax=Oceanivirga salmonicida TaxID=1769291 RepID=UPI00082BF4A8|nr:peptidylprolyl isomerase [Oceanivirga salmonicida]